MYSIANIPKKVCDNYILISDYVIEYIILYIILMTRLMFRI